MDKHWHILGAGAIGCLWASWLQERCTLIIKPAYSGLLKNSAEPSEIKLKIESNSSIKEFEVFACTPEKLSNPISNLLVCTKANQTEEAIQSLNLATKANIVLMQNGMGNQELLHKIYPESSIFCASNTHGAYRKAPFHIVYAGKGQTHIGQATGNGKESWQKVEELAHSLTNESEKPIPDPEMEKRLWLKLAINCAINPLTAIYQCKNGELIEDPAKLDHMKKLCDEVDSILWKKGLQAESASCFNTVKQVAKDTKENYSSMYQDRNNKSQSEIDFIQGYLIKEARKQSLIVPENEKVLATIKEIESTY